MYALLVLKQERKRHPCIL